MFLLLEPGKRWALPVVVVAAVATLCINTSWAEGVKTPDHPSSKPSVQHTSATSVNPVDLLKDPQAYLNKTIVFQGTFSSFTSLGLDYKKAYRNAQKYVGLLINRPDVSAHEIPMSELKMFYPREKGEALIHIESGDRIAITGTVFSTALNEPWLDVSEVKILEKANPDSGKEAASSAVKKK